MQQKPLFVVGCFAFLILTGLLLLLLAATIVLSLIPLYLSKTTTNTNSASHTLQAVYATNFKNATYLVTGNSPSLSNSLHSQMSLSKNNKANVLTSQFLPLSLTNTSDSRKKRENPCDYDITGMDGDQYMTEIQFIDPTVCRTERCYENFKTKVESTVRQYSSLSLPFQRTSDQSSVDIPMKLCKVGTLFSSENAKILTVCELIKKNLSSSSQLFYPSDNGYNNSIKHYVFSSTAKSICSVEPATTADVAMIIKLIGQYRVPFAIKGGGHAMNPKFSSTNGIHISMTRFQKVVFHQDNQTVDVGAGLLWNEVYEKLDSYNITVAGGRYNGVGVGGLILGGGYSWKSSQYGLSVDNVYEYELVSPNGTIVYVNNQSYADIFFGLKGGLNNFGIVTNFNMRALPQTQIYGGILVYISPPIDVISKAIVNFYANNKDPKLQLMLYFAIVSKQFAVTVIVCYDTPNEPVGILDELLSIPHIGALQTQAFYSLVEQTAGPSGEYLRGRFATLSISNYTETFLKTCIDELFSLNSTFGSRPGVDLYLFLQTFVSSILAHSHTAAYAHYSTSALVIPMALVFTWTAPSDDDDLVDAMKSTRNLLYQAALDQGQNVNGSNQIQYPNYALDDAPLSQIYGSNLARLQNIRKAWDPNNVMYLTGGFKL